MMNALTSAARPFFSSKTCKSFNSAVSPYMTSSKKPACLQIPFQTNHACAGFRPCAGQTLHWWAVVTDGTPSKWKYDRNYGVDSHSMLGMHLTGLINMARKLEEEQYRNCKIFYQHKALRRYLSRVWIARKVETVEKLAGLQDICSRNNYELCFGPKEAKLIEQFAVRCTLL